MIDLFIKKMVWLRSFVSYLGGSAEEPPGGLNLSLTSFAWGIWWGLLLIIILIFCGQSSKFIYIDF